MRKYRCQYLSEWDEKNKPFKAYRLICEAIKSFKQMEENKLIPADIEEFKPQMIIDAYQKIVPAIKVISDIGSIAKK